MNFRIFGIIILLLTICGDVYGQGIFKKLKKGKGEGTEVVLDTLAIALPDGMKYYPCSVENEKWVAKGEADIPGFSSEQIFVNALLYTIEQAEAGKKHILVLNVSEKSFSLLMQLPSKFYPESKTYYKYANTFKAENGKLSFLSTEMHVCSNNLFGDLKETLFENLQPEKKSKHKNHVNELATENSIYLNNLFAYIKEKKSQPVNHWTEIVESNIIKGMNETECLLAVGKPQHIRPNGKQTKWMVNNDFVVMFEDGIVIRVIK